jgi:organic radical activating enzyme
MKVIEIFDSIQGEGCHLGVPANFIRLAGCNLKCPWCDTDWSPEKAIEMPIDEICNKIANRRILTVITGGEPFIWGEQLEQLIDAIIKKCDTFVAIETNGTYPTKHIKDKYGAQVWITCSPKPEKHWRTHSDCVYDELKFVVDDKITYVTIAQYFDKDVPIWLQPEASNMQEAWKICNSWAHEAALEADVRVGVQLHKLMEVR